MIDFKSSAHESYNKLKSILSNYQTIISTLENSMEQKRPVKVFLSGNRPIQELLNNDSILTR